MERRYPKWTDEDWEQLRFTQKLHKNAGKTLEMLKTVLGEGDTDGSEFFCTNCGEFAELITLLCTNPDCPRHKARQHVKELEATP